jgi:hypothetical protein
MVYAVPPVVPLSQAKPALGRKSKLAVLPPLPPVTLTVTKFPLAVTEEIPGPVNCIPVAPAVRRFPLVP